MNIAGVHALVTGGASGLGRAAAEALLARDAVVTLVDLPSSRGREVAEELGPRARFAAADVTDAEGVRRALTTASEGGELRVVVHCAGRGGPVRVLDKDGVPGAIDAFERIVRTNLVGTFNVLRLGAESMAGVEELDGERGVCVLTASIAAFEGQVGQSAYASSKAGVVGLTLVAARDLARRKIRVCTIAPGVFATPMLSRLSAPALDALGRATPHPSRLGDPRTFGMLTAQIVENPMLNGETIRLDGALRMAAQ